LKKISIFAFFGKTTPYKKFQNHVPKGFIASSIDVLCSDFVKFGRREIGKVLRYLPDKKINLRLALSFSLLRDMSINSVSV